MKIFFFSILFFTINATAQSYVVKENSGLDQTGELQNAFNNPQVNTVIINGTAIIIQGKLNIPEGKILKFEQGKITGNGIINGGIIEANYQSQIFGTTITINPKAVNQYFSVKWYGAMGNDKDDYYAIQKCINVCIKNNIRTLYFPVGKYKISQPLILRGKEKIVNKGNDSVLRRGFCTLELLGESSFWDSNTGSEISATFTNSFVIGIQNGKGCKVRKLKLNGLFRPPYNKDIHKFFNCDFNDFTDGVCRDSRYSPYAAIVIDPFTNLPKDALPADGGYPGLNTYYGKSNRLASASGSTATELEELSIVGFVVGICSSPNGITRNAEITLINKVHFTNCKLCVSGGQDQEKDNVISNIYCWGGTHTIFATGLYGSSNLAGNWNIDHANIAGAVVRFIYNEQSGYFPTYISHVFAESLGSFGTFNSRIACEVSDCIFDFALPDIAGKQILLSSFGDNVIFRSCNFRYYGKTTPLQIEGNCVFDHCYFSGSIKNNNLAKNLYGTARQKFSKKDLIYIWIIASTVSIISIIIYFIQKKLKN